MMNDFLSLHVTYVVVHLEFFREINVFTFKWLEILFKNDFIQKFRLLVRFCYCFARRLESPPSIRSMRTSTLTTDDRVTSLARVLADFGGSVTKVQNQKQPKNCQNGHAKSQSGNRLPESDWFRHWSQLWSQVKKFQSLNIWILLNQFTPNFDCVRHFQQCQALTKEGISILTQLQ